MWLRRPVLILVWALSLAGAMQWGMKAQSRQGTPQDGLVTGDNLAFKPTGTRDGLIFGTVQIRINGTWRGVVVVDEGPTSVVKQAPVK
jgi:hypothetical protein